MVIVIIRGMVSEVTIIIRDLAIAMTIMMIVREIVIKIAITITIVTTKTIAINPISTT
jgi:hypothetical protein